MTLNMTLISARVIYQSADFRLTDARTHRPRDFDAQKGILIQRRRWAVLVAFAGVGHTGRLDIPDWMATVTGELAHDASFDELVAVLRKANIWLQTVPRDIRRHTFSIGAFVGVRPKMVLVSNYETTFARPRPQARSEMTTSFVRPTRPRILLAGRPDSVSRVERRYLLHLLQEDVPADQMFEALWRVNQQAASRDSTISPACFTTYIRKTGEGGGRALGLDESKDYMPAFARRPFSQDLGRILQRGVDERGQPKPLRLVQVAVARSEPTDEFHREQLKAKPNSAEVHNNYGVYLYDNKKDVQGAEKAYLRAIELDPNYCNALGNYATLLRNERGDMDAAEALYKRAIEADPHSTIQIRNYAGFLKHVRNATSEAEDLYKAGLAVNPSDANLLKDYADLQQRMRRAAGAAEVWEQYIALRPTDAEALAACAACHTMAGADANRPEELYRTALEQKPDLTAALVNLAQLEFLRGARETALKLLERCLGSGPAPDHELEAWFYRYAYEANSAQALAEVRRLILSGVRSPGWNLAVTVEHASQYGHPNRPLLRALESVITNEDVSAECLAGFPDWHAAATST